jgi:hypothetical protein
MSIRLEIDNADASGRVDYTRYVASPDSTPIMLRDRLNRPALLDFALVPADAQFLLPRRSAYVQLSGLADALPPGQPRVPGPLFTGYITNEPASEFLGVSNGAPVYGYRFQATSEDYLLNVKRIGPLPPFLNQAAGAILRQLAELLQPGRFDLSGVADGPLVPYFAPQPDELWMDIARELAERSGYYYRVLDAKLYFQPLGDFPAGVTLDESELRFRPEALEVQPVGNPIHNDVTVFGEIEPQAVVTEVFAGDGFTSRFPLVAPVFGTVSARLLADDFTSPVLDSSRWLLADPAGEVTMFEGRLNITGGTGVAAETHLAARQAVELGGELELTHGEFEFVAPSTGILGGIYSQAAPAPAACLAGFDVSPAAGTTRIRAMVNGGVEAAEVLVQSGHHYVLETRLSADRLFRTTESFASLNGAFGGGVQAATVRVSLLVRDFNLAAPLEPTTIVLHESTQSGWPEAATYAPILAADVHAAVNFLQVARPIQALLETSLPGKPPQRRTLGFGIASHDATITSDPNQNQWALEFYPDSIPARGATISLRYRAAGRARARVRDAASVAAEAALAGDDGVRATVLESVNPPPRTSAEAEFAARAYLADHTAPRYEGRYSTWSDFVESFPRSGRFLQVRATSRFPEFPALVRSVTHEFRELETERILHTLEFGRPSFFEELLRQFLPSEGVLESREEGSLPPADSQQAGTEFLDDPAGVNLGALQPAFVQIVMAAPPPAGGVYEIRRSDSGWSAAGIPGSAQNLLASISAQSVLLPRTSRKMIFYIRPVDAGGKTSRFSAALALHLPLIPPQTASLVAEHGRDDFARPIIRARVAVAANSAGLADVDAVELRGHDDSTVLARWEFGQLRLENEHYVAEFALDNSVALTRSKTFYAYTRNALGEYSAARSAIAVKFEPPKPSLSPGSVVGQILEVLFDRASEEILETEIMVIGPTDTPSNPFQVFRLPGQPEKITFVATQSGGWEFRARRRDALGWSPWNSEPQGQISAEHLVFIVQFLQARFLDPSIGAAVNAQNLLPNSDFFLGGIAGQEGVNAPRYFSLVNANSNGSEAAHSAATNELQWKSGVNFAAADPGFRLLLTNFGGLFNPGEPLTLSAALRHSGTATFPRPVRLALLSPGTPSFQLSVDVAADTIGTTYRWFSATFTLPANAAVPSDLAAQIAVVVPAGQSLASDLFCDKLILNRGHRPAAFSLAPWDIAGLEWNASAGGYDLPPSVVAPSPRASNPGQAGILSGTGTEDLDPEFTSRFQRYFA